LNNPEQGTLFEVALQNLPGLWPLRVGNQVSYEGTRPNAAGQLYAHTQTVKVLSESTVRLEDGDHRVFVLERNTQNRVYRGTVIDRYTVDAAMNAVVRVEDFRPAVGYEADRRAVSISVPSSPPGT
jgi:hypothetical protein